MVVLFCQSIVAQTISVAPKQSNEGRDLHVSALAPGVDPTTRLAPSSTKAPLQNFTRLSRVTTGGTVLWDLTHGVDFNYSPSGDYNTLSALLE